jgi:hypothetical protein
MAARGLADCHDDLQGILGLCMQVFKRLEDPSSPSFQLCVSILDIFSQVCIIASHACQPTLQCSSSRVS